MNEIRYFLLRRHAGLLATVPMKFQEQTLMVGDSFEKDVVIPNRVGMQSVWFNRQTQEIRKGNLFCTIHSLPELLPLLTQI